jgi:hypothetical protein
MKRMQYLGLASVVWLTLSLIIMFLLWPPEMSKTLSQNAARKRSSIIYYGIIFGIFLIPFTLYILGWFVPQLGLGAVFSVVYLFGLLGQIIALIIPETTGVKVTVHRIAAFAMTLSLMALTGLLALSPQVAGLRLWFSVLVFAWMAFSWVLFIFAKRTHKYSLVFQLLYSYLFLILVIIR